MVGHSKDSRCDAAGWVFAVGLPSNDMATKLDKTLKREIEIDGQAYIVTLDPQGLKLTEKGRRKGQEILWKDLVNGGAALARSLNASLDEAE
jgi:hypothetical protein